MTDKKEDPISEIIEHLNLEQDQEAQVTKGATSFFSSAPPDEVLIARAREYDDLAKHLVRRNFWLRTAKELKERKGRPLRLLTLPGRHRLEIELYRSHGIFGPTSLDEDLPVVGFETSPDVFGLLKLASPPFSRLFHADLIETISTSSAQHHGDLLELFPFDIINLDLTVNLVAPKEGPYGPVLQSIRECFKLQGSHAYDWALMLTFRAMLEDTSPDTIDELKQLYQNNLNDHVPIRQAFYERYHLLRAEQILHQDPEDALGQFTAKWIIDQAHTFDFRLVESRHLFYRRLLGTRNYSIRKLIFRFRKERIPPFIMPRRDSQALPWQIDDLVTIVGKTRSVDVDSRLEGLRTSSPEFVEKLAHEIETLKSSPAKAENSDADLS